MPNLADHLFRRAQDSGDKVALHFQGQRHTFAGLARAVRAVAGGLAAAGIGIGTRVGLLMGSSPDFIIFQQAIFMLGATLSPLNIHYQPGEVADAIDNCELEYLVIGDDLLGRLPAAAGRPARLRGIIVQADRRPADPALSWATDLINAAHPVDAPVSLPETAIGLMLHTSATTGRAKGVMLSLANIRANYDRTPEWLGLDGDVVILCALPLYNTFGLNQCINAMMVMGGTLVLLPRFDAAACAEAIETHGCRFFPAVPTMLHKLLDHAEATGRDLSCLKRIMTGGAPVPPVLLERMQRAMGPAGMVLTGYGLTEATALVTLETVEQGSDGQLRRPKSIGRVLPGMEMRAFREDGTEAATGEVGEFRIRGPNLMAGYYKRPDETAATIRDGWLLTGDLGRFDEQGHAYIVDRKKDLIIRGGQNIYPADIEEVLYRLDGVGEAAVVGQPDPVLGEVPVAYIAAQAGIRLDPESIVDHCRQRLAPFKVPAAIHLLPELPKGPTGKILRRALRAG